MSKEQGKQPVSKRFFVQSTDVVQRALQHLAIDLETSAEKLAGFALAEFVERAQRDADAARRVLPHSQPPRKPK
jgi:predicted transcriptional regulator